MGIAEALISRTAIGRPEHRQLLRGALIGILAVALSSVSVAALGAALLHLSAAYVPKVLLLFAGGAAVTLLALPGSHAFLRLGAANQVTIVRGALVALLAGLTGEHGSPAIATVAVVVASAEMILDGVDGRLARRSGMASGFGARLDMETDAVFVAVLALLVWQFGKAGSWVLLSGLMRYLFAGIVALVPRLRRPVPSTFRGKTIAVLQMIALVVALAPLCSPTSSARVAAVGLLALVLSFALDVVWLLRQPVPDAP
ncbi:MAG: CDP-alcohol phosphatidyltransferase family protein [Steroidobacteraceae bacterium]